MPVLTKINTNVIADDAVTGDKFSGDAYLSNTATQNISGTYSENRLYTSDAYTLSGNATINSHLTLSSIKPTADVVLTADGPRTITGTGVLSAGSLLAKSNTDASQLTGEIGSTVTFTGGLENSVTFPAGKVTNIFRLIDDISGEYQANVDSSASKVPANAMSWPAISGRHYLVSSQCMAEPWANGTSSSGRTQTTRLFVGTTNRSEGDTQASTSGPDKMLFQAFVGRNLTGATTTGDHGYWLINMQGFFTAGSTATHYVYLTIHSTAAINSRFGCDWAKPWTVIIHEIMP